jgi:hypothetical protein
VTLLTGSNTVRACRSGHSTIIRLGDWAIVGHGARSRAWYGALVAAALLVNGCAHEAAPTPPPAEAKPALKARFDPVLQPAAAVLALVPKDVATVTVTDFEQVRLDLGLPDVTDASSPADQATFWQRAIAERPLLTTGMLRPDDAQLTKKYGFSSLDVGWEAHFLDSDGHQVGWALGFRAGFDMSAVQQAVLDGAAPLTSSDVDLADRIVSQGTTTEPTESWAADADLVALVDGTQPADSTYLSTACETPAATGSDLEPLDGWSIQLQATVATARLGEGRQDLFDRLALGQSDPAFTAAFSGGAADPATGRIGYAMTDPAAAAQLTLDRQLPFAACSPAG